ncbi:MAG: glycosyltransferase [Bacteroidetes bacterium]|nr:glycosyltransferase [Bacteroidota bacterium]
MTILAYISVTICALYIGLQVWQLLVLLLYKNQPEPAPVDWPEISILVAARNEEENIGNCLQALCQLNYPAEKLHIIVGDDQSTDKTATIAREIAGSDSRIQIISIKDDGSGLKAKARVMAQLDQAAKGDYYLVTDADVQVKPDWAAMMVRQLHARTGVASGTTMVKGKSVWGKLQGIDWAYFMGLLNAISYSGVPATAVGNNMIVRKKAYWQTGGYANIRFSITEDYKLYSEICRHGWGWNNAMCPEVLAYSAPTNGYLPLLHQRKRWLSGGRELPFYWWILFGVFALYYISVPFLFLVAWPVALAIAALKWTLQTLQINAIYSHVKEPKPAIWQHLMYEVYLWAVTISTALFFVLPVKTIWKERKY